MKEIEDRRNQHRRNWNMEAIHTTQLKLVIRKKIKQHKRNFWEADFNDVHHKKWCDKRGQGNPSYDYDHGQRVIFILGNISN